MAIALTNFRESNHVWRRWRPQSTSSGYALNDGLSGKPIASLALWFVSSAAQATGFGSALNAQRYAEVDSCWKLFFWLSLLRP